MLCVRCSNKKTEGEGTLHESWSGSQTVVGAGEKGRWGDRDMMERTLWKLDFQGRREDSGGQNWRARLRQSERKWKAKQKGTNYTSKTFVESVENSED